MICTYIYIYDDDLKFEPPPPPALRMVDLMSPVDSAMDV